jgi:hypothetical protein
MLRKTTLILALALTPALAMAANAGDTVKRTAPLVEGGLLSPERVRELLTAQGALHVSPLKRVGANDYKAKILTAAKGWNKVYVDGRTGKVIDDPLYGFRHQN